MIDALEAGKALCKMSNWSMTSLQLQKVLYYAHMFYLGASKGKSLLKEDFQAWEYGPVLPSLYHHVKRFGNKPIREYAFFWQNDIPEDSAEYKCLLEMYLATKEISSSKMVRISHWEEGAWYETYKPGERDVVIPREAILKEYRARHESAS